MKQTKMAKLRILLPTIEDLLTQYTYEGVIEVLKENYDLELNHKTFRNYIYRLRKELADQPKHKQTLNKIDTIANQKTQPIKDLPTKVDNINDGDSNDDNPSKEDIKKALEDFNKATATRSIKSVSKLKGKTK